ncbi:hypothetical protein DOY81_008619 [Sarcophaga bullata]|nr:hypothetical protein DOY81_008619 [Sarcophaga bullata]
MLVFNIFCSLCKAQFKNDDAVYSTRCGHIFHFTCMNQWQCRSTSCPVCRTYKPETYRIYLNFADLCKNDIEAKLIANKKRIAEMQAAIKKKDQKIYEIQRLYNVSEQWRAELQDKIENLMSNAESNKINLIVTFTTIERKEEFLSNRMVLKMNSSTGSIRIKEFTNNDVYTLFKYANAHLRPNGYHFIYVKGSTVIARRNNADKYEIFIRNKSDIDKLLRKYAAIRLAG